jgi:hypothetical protein
MESIIVIKIILFCKATYCGKYNRTPLIRTLVIRIGLARRVNLSRILKKKLNCLEIADYRIMYRTVLWLLELHIRRGRKV